MAGRLDPLAGEMRRSGKMRVGYFAQHQEAELVADDTPVAHMARALPHALPPQVRAQLARFGLDADRAETPSKNLSGGERARLLLALATREAPHLLILDEPTNHLDIDARDALVRALGEYEGAVLLITHDPDLVELVADRLWLVGDGTVRPYDGDMADYRALLGPTPPVSGDFHVGEGFTELRMPLADHMPGAESLALEAGYRYSAYSLGFDTNTYKFGVEWAPIQDVLLRTSYQRAVRAPNISELYSPQAIGLDFTADPCAGAAPTFSQAQCALTGVTAAQYGHINPNPSNQYNGLLGGNPELKPEVSTTKAVGIVFKPRALPNFSTSVDFFMIGIAGDITSVGGGVILQQCLTTSNPLYCNLIHRNATGSLWNSESGYVTDTTINVGSQSTKGFDVKANYRQPLGDQFGSLAFNLEGTRTLQLITQPLTGGPTYDCVGFEGQTCGAGQPKWRHVLNTTWDTPWSGLSFVARWRFISAVQSDTSSSNPILNKGLPVPPGSNIPTYSYLDLSASVALSKQFKLTLGANNILDKDPPLITGSDCAAVSGTPGVACNGNTWPGSYDSLGRYLYAHVTAQF